MRTHKDVNHTTQKLIEDNTSFKLVCKLGEVLDNRGITQSELSLLTGIRLPSINEMIHDKKNTINKKHLTAIMIVLSITDISELYDIVLPVEERDYYQAKSREAKELGLCEEMQEILQIKRELND